MLKLFSNPLISLPGGGRFVTQLHTTTFFLESPQHTQPIAIFLISIGPLGDVYKYRSSSLPNAVICHLSHPSLNYVTPEHSLSDTLSFTISLRVREHILQLQKTTGRIVALHIIKLNSVACSPQANYTDRATAAC
jgi:hypothetical protein